jgi:uncharacterized damage-inducible protein DinB
MIEFFKDIFEYHNHFNQKLADLLSENRDQISERTKKLFSHSINAHQLWNSRILNFDPFAVLQMHSFEKVKIIDKENYLDTLKILKEYDLENKIEYQNSKGQKFENSIQQILFHIANHFTHHRGQIISNLRQRGIEPLVTDYIFYKR